MDSLEPVIDVALFALDCPFRDCFPPLPEPYIMLNEAGKILIMASVFYYNTPKVETQEGTESTGNKSWKCFRKKQSNSNISRPLARASKIIYYNQWNHFNSQSQQIFVIHAHESSRSLSLSLSLFLPLFSWLLLLRHDNNMIKWKADLGQSK